MKDTITIIHLTTPLDAPICPKCGGGHEDEGGPVHRAGSMDYGPLYWECDDCVEPSGYGPMVSVQWGHV